MSMDRRNFINLLSASAAALVIDPASLLPSTKTIFIPKVTAVERTNNLSVVTGSSWFREGDIISIGNINGLNPATKFRVGKLVESGVLPLERIWA